MKKITILSLFLVSTVANASILTCTSSTLKEVKNSSIKKAITLITGTKMTGTCDIRNPLNMKVLSTLKFEITDMGVGYRMNGLNSFLLTCPGVSKKELLQNEFYGTKVSPLLMMGAELGVFATKRGEACLLTGLVNLTVSSGISGSQLKFIE